MKKLKVGLVGYYGWGNYGDEFFKDVLKTKLPGVSFKLMHDVGEGGKLSLDNIDENVESVDAILIGGGDLVIPYAMSPLYWREEFLRKPVVVYGVGVPRWGGYDNDVVMKMRAFMQHPAIKNITARDQESADWITAQLKPAVSVGCMPDIVCAYQHRHVIPRDRAFGVVLRHQGNGLDRASVKALLDQVRARGYHPRILMLATDKTLSDDFESVGRLDLGDADIIVRSNLEALTDELLSCDRVASMKFHGCVVALSHNIPCLALSQANKFKNFYAELNRSAWLGSLSDPTLSAKLDAVMDVPNYQFPDHLRQASIDGLHELKSTLVAAAKAGVVPSAEVASTAAEGQAVGGPEAGTPG